MTSAAPILIVYWDIDGTLLTTGRAGVPALEDGAESVLGRRPDLSGMPTSGLTDRMIARKILLDAGRQPDEELEGRLLAAYTAALPARLTQKRGHVLPGVAETLTDLAVRGDVANVLLTGNMRAGAVAKLASYGLAHHFDLGAFAEDGHGRSDIARAAIERARSRFGDVALTGVLVGDTPYDCAGGRTVGLRVIAVAGSVADRPALEACNPWWLVDRVPTADELVAHSASHVGHVS